MATYQPRSEEIERAVVALVPFVTAWNLPLNPEELYEIASAVLEHALSDAPVEEVHEAVATRIVEFQADIDSMHEAMSRAIEARGE